MFTADIDIRGFNRFVEGIQNALIGTGQDGDLFKVVKSEARQLSLEISNQLGPRTAAQGEKSIEKDMRETFRPGPTQAFEASKRKGAGGQKLPPIQPMTHHPILNWLIAAAVIAIIFLPLLFVAFVFWCWCQMPTIDTR